MHPMITEPVFFNILIITWTIFSAVVFVMLFFVAAPYGRHARKGWGFSIDNRLGWLVMEAPAALIFLIFYVFGKNNLSLISIIFLVLWETHYVHRAFICPLSLKKRIESMPIFIASSGLIFNIVNGYLNARYLFTFSNVYPIAWLTDSRFIIGLLTFIFGYFINRYSDHILLSLRHNHDEGYQITYGVPFNFMSCPNYLGELLIWTGWAIMTWSLPGFVFLLWTAANLIPRARTHHKWYHQNFINYPVERKALIPKLW